MYRKRKSFFSPCKTGHMSATDARQTDYPSSKTSPMSNMGDGLVPKVTRELGVPTSYANKRERARSILGVRKSFHRVVYHTTNVVSVVSSSCVTHQPRQQPSNRRQSCGSNRNKNKCSMPQGRLNQEQTTTRDHEFRRRTKGTTINPKQSIHGVFVVQSVSRPTVQQKKGAAGNFTVTNRKWDSRHTLKASCRETKNESQRWSSLSLSSTRQGIFPNNKQHDWKPKFSASTEQQSVTRTFGNNNQQSRGGAIVTQVSSNHPRSSSNPNNTLSRTTCNSAMTMTPNKKKVIDLTQSEHGIPRPTPITPIEKTVIDLTQSEHDILLSPSETKTFQRGHGGNINNKIPRQQSLKDKLKSSKGEGLVLFDSDEKVQVIGNNHLTPKKRFRKIDNTTQWNTNHIDPMAKKIRPRDTTESEGAIASSRSSTPSKKHNETLTNTGGNHTRWPTGWEKAKDSDTTLPLESNCSLHPDRMVVHVNQCHSSENNNQKQLSAPSDVTNDTLKETLQEQLIAPVLSHQAPGSREKRSVIPKGPIGTQGLKRVAKDASKYSNKGLSSNILQASRGVEIPMGQRLYARVRNWDKRSNHWGPWKPYFTRIDGQGDEQTFYLKRGGELKFMMNLLQDIPPIRDEMEKCKHYRQYTVRNTLEPRAHALFSSAANTKPHEVGYKYGQVKMQAQPLSQLKTVSELASQLASKFRLPNNEWNIGLDLMIYRDGKDSINWHADDTQEEDIVLCLTVESPENTRTVCIQPSCNRDLEEGDEQYELFPAAGDAYEMDSTCSTFFHRSSLRCTLPSSFFCDKSNFLQATCKKGTCMPS